MLLSIVAWVGVAKAVSLTTCATGSELQQAIVSLLCTPGAGSYEMLPETTGRDAKKPQVVGLFAQLNMLLQFVLRGLYAGVGPRHLDDIYNTQLLGYGSEPIGKHFAPSFACTMRSCLPRMRAVATIKGAPRYTTVSTLLHLLLSPRSLVELHSVKYDLAIHVRRGDRLWVSRSVERIAVWTSEDIAVHAAQMLQAASNSTPATLQRVLLASDDNTFSAETEKKLRTRGFAVDVLSNDAEAFDSRNRSIEAAKVCGSACVAPLIEMARRFSQASQLLLSSKSNLGGFLLSSWGAAHSDGMSSVGGLLKVAVYDLDRMLKPNELPEKYFCELEWGSRHGMCRPAESACDQTQFRERNFCKGSGGRDRHSIGLTLDHRHLHEASRGND